MILSSSPSPRSWLVDELYLLSSYDKAGQLMQKIVDMPDRLIDLFIQLCLQGGGRTGFVQSLIKDP